MNRADAGASQHRNRGLGDHREIDRDPIAFLDAAPLQHVGEPAHSLVQLAVGDPPILAGVVALPQDRGLPGTFRQVAIDAVVGCVERPVLIPGDADIAPERGVPHLGERPDPIDALAVLGPKAVRLGERLSVESKIVGFADLARLRMGRDRDDGSPRHGVLPPRQPTLAARRDVSRGYSAPLSAYNTCRAARLLNGGYRSASPTMPPGSGWRH